MSDAERFKHFWSRVEIRHEFECWGWNRQINRDSGYGVYRRTTAHRQSYLLTFGVIPDGHMVCHRCDNRICVNPNHLFTGTNLDNMKDMWLKGGRNLPEQNKPFTDAEIREIRASEESNTAAGKRFGVSQNTISQIRRFKKYKYVTMPC